MSFSVVGVGCCDHWLSYPFTLYSLNQLFGFDETFSNMHESSSQQVYWTPPTHLICTTTTIDRDPSSVKHAGMLHS